MLQFNLRNYFMDIFYFFSNIERVSSFTFADVQHLAADGELTDVGSGGWDHHGAVGGAGHRDGGHGGIFPRSRSVWTDYVNCYRDCRAPHW